MTAVNHNSLIMSLNASFVSLSKDQLFGPKYLHIPGKQITFTLLCCEALTQVMSYVIKDELLS